MTEFSDFLKHRLAYVAIGEFKPGKFDEAKQLFEQAIATYSQGFKGAYLLQEPDTDKGIAIIFWENMDDVEANQSDVYKSILNKISHLFEKAPKTGFHEVCSLIQPTAGSTKEL
jgi:heme-degrading monooxygenase HmoA